MNKSEVLEFVSKMDNVQQEENYGYTFFSIGDDNLLPFVTLADSDNEYDSVSNLNREGVFRINIGVSRETFTSLIGDYNSDDIDYSALNVFLPHPDYAKQNFICILNPSQDNVEKTKTFIREAHANAKKRLERKSSK